jgi:hypothetical protein
LAEGIHLQVGNLVIEVGDGRERLNRRPNRELNLAQRWGNPEDDKWGRHGNWFAMSHIAEKDLLHLSEQVKPGMIHGMRLTPETYVQSYKDILEIIRLNPAFHINGVLSDGTWAYSDELAQVFPDQHISKLHDVAGDVVNIGTATELGMPIQEYFATLNPERRAAFVAGKYKVTIAARFIDVAGMEVAIAAFS